MNSKHVAYIFVNECTKREYDPFGNETVTVIKFDEPKEKMIASGDPEFCSEKLAEYQAKHPDTQGGVIETMEKGDPWHRFWSTV